MQLNTNDLKPIIYLLKIRTSRLTKIFVHTSIIARQGLDQNIDISVRRQNFDVWAATKCLL